MERPQRVPVVLLLALVLIIAIAHTGRAAGPPVVISEVLVGNASTNIDPDYTNYSSWVELHNTDSSAVNLSGFKMVTLREGRATPDSYTLPSGVSIPAGGRLLIWYDEEGSGVHTPFELDMDGVLIELRTPANELVDGVLLDEQRPDISFGRASGSGWAYFDTPTPGTANTTPEFADTNGTFAASPSFSVPGGRYGGSQSLALSTTEPGGVVRYTLDGSKPTGTSPAYGGPIALNSTTVVRARTFAAGKMTSPTVTQTYLINVPANLPAISIATDPAHMFDNQIGIYVIGTNGVKHCTKKANWHQPWERPASIEMYDTSGTRLFGQDVGFEIHGNCTRNLNMKSFEIKARKIYGDNEINYPLFDDRSMTSFSRLVLRTGGQDSKNTLLRDALGSQMLSGFADVDRSAYRPTVLYINGQFWGIYALREKADENLVEHLYGLDEETDFDALQEQAVVLAGNANRWNTFYNYIKNNDPANAAVYNYLKTQMDMVAFIDYQITEIYTANTDWPHNNIRYWSAYGPDGRWRWILHDLDYGFSNHLPAGFNHNTLKLATSLKGSRAYNSLILVRLTRNAEFRALFAQRFAAHLNTTFNPTRMTALINDMAADIAPDMPAQVARWKLPKSMTIWNTQVAKLRTFVQKRPDPVRNHLNTYLGGPGTAALTTIAGAGGDILVAGIAAPDTYSGLHFRQTPVTLTAVPEPGEEFVEWLETGQTTPEITVTFSGPATYTAVFGEAPPPPPLPNIIINEIHYRPLPEELDEPNKEFIELYHAGETVADLSGYTIPAISYTFPPGSLVGPGEYVVVAANSADPLFAALDADDVFDFAWGDPAEQKLSNGGEEVTLRHSDGRVVDSVTYTDDPPWPTEPDQNDKTLSLLEESLNNSLAASWAASREVDGTPGAENFPPLPPPPPVIINEVHYNPAPGQGADSEFEFIELLNTSADPVDLSGFKLAGVEFTFPDGESISPGEYIVVAANSANYGGGYDAYQWTNGDLDDAGERVALLDPFDQVVDEVTYDGEAPWVTAPNGSGPTLSLGSPTLDNSVAANWGASRQVGGTPGAVNFPPLPLVINELHHTPSTAQGSDNAYEFFELYNDGLVAIDLSGYQFVGVDANDMDNPLPEGTSIAPGEYIVVADTPATYENNNYQVFDFDGGLTDNGERVAVLDRFGNLVDEVTYGVVAPWPSTPNAGGPSLSLLDPSDDNSDPTNWDASREVGGTPGAENFPPLPPVPPLVINEIHYNPASSQGPDADFEFIEIVNISADLVELDGFTLSGVGFTFPAGATMAAGEYIVVAANSANYGGGYDAYQWTNGDLADDGETITLKDAADQVVDEVTYSNGGSWPAAPDGNGPSLSLGAPSLDNSVAANWAASDFDDGTPGAANWPALPLVVSEVHYSVNETLQPGGDNDWEFFEVYNAGNRTFDLSGYTTEGINATLSAGATIAAGETIVIANNAATYATAGCTVYDWASGGLSSNGETLTFRNRFNVPVLAFTYGSAAPWPVEPKGTGPTLSLLALSYDNSLPANWAASREVGGTPCAANFPSLSLVINEIHYNPDDINQGPDADYEFIEIVNVGATAVNLSGYMLEGVDFPFPIGTTLAAGEYLVIAANATTYPGALRWTGGDLNDDGETIILKDAAGRVVDEVAYSNTGDWPVGPAGGGPSLALESPSGDNSLAENWSASLENGGTPGAENFPGP